MSKDKLEGFGPIYIINLKRRLDRRIASEGILKENNIEDYTFVEAIDYQNSDLDELCVHPVKEIRKNELACTLSHIKAIRQWLETSDSEYAIIMEDDFSFETVSYWNFTWKDFFNSINFEYDILQLSITNDHMTPDLHKRQELDFSAGVYLIKRSGAIKIMNKIGKSGKCLLPDYSLADALMYSMSNTYSIPLFTYMIDNDSDINPEHKKEHKKSRDLTLEYWRNNKVIF